ncbi:MAG: hypothetical protein BMS9Abin07_0710 [Acidimicrobiia bacterium]|nr:MAG: hypothetical protein BMS9Abin07_0710 [Acidimicrobiia bacterium]
MILAVVALGVVTVLAIVPALEAGEAAPIALGAGTIALAFTGWALMTGATPPLLMAALLLFAEIAGAIVFGSARPAMVPIAAAGLFLLVEMSVRSLETRGRHPGWRDFRWSDAVRSTGVATLVGLMAWLVSVSATGIDVSGGIFMHSVGIAAAAAVIGVIWLLVGRGDTLHD